MTKRPFGHGDLRNMSNFKAVAADYAYYLTLSDEGRLYCLTDRQVYVLMVQNTYTAWLTRWYNTDDINQLTVQYIAAEIEERLMSCVDVQILVDQANENLVTNTINRSIQSQTLRLVLEDRYDGSPTSINPAAPTSDFGSDGDRFDALCAGLMAFVYQFARYQADSVRAGQIGGLAAISLIAALLIPGLNIFLLVGASIAVLIGLGTVGVTTEVAIQALTDTDALDAVVCCMRDNLKDLEVTEANWVLALGGCGFAGGSHEQIVADFLGATLADNYLTILNILGQAYTGVIDGEQLPACPCEVPPPDLPIVNFEVGGRSGGTWAEIGARTVRFTAGQTPALDGFYRVAWQWDIETPPVVKIVSVTLSVMETTYKGWYTPGYNPAVNGYDAGGYSDGALPADNSTLVKAAIYTNTTAFTMDIEFGDAE